MLIQKGLMYWGHFDLAQVSKLDSLKFTLTKPSNAYTYITFMKFLLHLKHLFNDTPLNAEKI